MTRKEKLSAVVLCVSTVLIITLSELMTKVEASFTGNYPFTYGIAFAFCILGMVLFVNSLAYLLYSFFKKDKNK